MARLSSTRLLYCLMVAVFCFNYGTATRPLVRDEVATLSAMRSASTVLGKPQRRLLFWYYAMACPVGPNSIGKSAFTKVATSGNATASATAVASTGDGTPALAMAECLPPPEGVSQTCEASADVRKAIKRRFRSCDPIDAAVVEALLDAKVPFKLKPKGIFFEQIPRGVTLPPLPSGVSLEDYRLKDDEKAALVAEARAEKADSGDATVASASASGVSSASVSASASASSSTPTEIHQGG